MIGKKEIAVDEKIIRQFCDQCNFKSWWNPKKAEQIYLVDFHKQLGCTGILKDERQYFESDPNLITE